MYFVMESAHVTKAEVKNNMEHLARTIVKYTTKARVIQLTYTSSCYILYSKTFGPKKEILV